MMKIFVALSLLGQIESLRLLSEPKDKFKLPELKLDKTIKHQKATSFHGVTRDAFALMSKAGKEAQCADWGCVTIPKWFQDLCCSYCLSSVGETFNGFADDMKNLGHYYYYKALYAYNYDYYYPETKPTGPGHGMKCHPLQAVKIESNAAGCPNSDWIGPNTVTETRYHMVDTISWSEKQRERRKKAEQIAATTWDAYKKESLSGKRPNVMGGLAKRIEVANKVLDDMTGEIFITAKGSIANNGQLIKDVCYQRETKKGIFWNKKKKAYTEKKDRRRLC